VLLARGIGVLTLISAASAASFYRELRERHWRFASRLSVVALVKLPYAGTGREYKGFHLEPRRGAQVPLP
jgi:hypothetical protein